MAWLLSTIGNFGPVNKINVQSLLRFNLKITIRQMYFWQMNVSQTNSYSLKSSFLRGQEEGWE